MNMNMKNKILKYIEEHPTASLEKIRKYFGYASKSTPKYFIDQLIQDGSLKKIEAKWEILKMDCDEQAAFEAADKAYDLYSGN